MGDSLTGMNRQVRFTVGVATGLLWFATPVSGWAARQVPVTRAPADTLEEIRVAGSLPAFNTLRTPSSPAFVVLGIEPASVERPNTPASFAASVLNATGEFVSIPQNYAIEISPFWLMRQSRLTWQRDVERTTAESLARTFTVSAATAQIGDEIRPVTGLSVGLRAAIRSGEMAAAAQSQLERIQQYLETESRLVDSLLTQLRVPIDAALTAVLADSAATGAQRQEALSQHARQMQQLGELVVMSDEFRSRRAETDELEVPDLAAAREGFVWDVAAGFGWQAPGAMADSIEFLGLGAWSNIGWIGTQWSIAGVARYQLAAIDTAFNKADMGVRLFLTEDRFAGSVEAVARFFTGSDAPAEQVRLAVLAEYELSNDLWLQGTFGRGFDPEREGSLIARLGLSFNLSRERYQLQR